ncbi:MAG: T9SS type A sorting domain-containing protein [Ignavibacteriae bacterium]|nr:T9SS type A sorting domain-containing protein [Ignavibacteriota bacterium]
MLDGNSFDINKNFNGQNSNFYAKYYTSSETDIEFETKINKAWSVSGEVSGGFKIPVIGIGTEIKIKSQYGKGFSKKKFTSNTYKVSQNITASSDDYIYATIIDYDIWEYPVLTNDEILGYVLVVEPGQPQRSWFPSKSPQAADYIPNHEVGNILSYNNIAAPTENGSLQQVLKWNTSDQITLDGSPGFQYNWALENETQTIVTASNEVNFKISGEASFDNPFKFTPDVKVKGNYSTKSISTRTNKVKYKKGLDVHLGPIDLGIGETYYSVTPYAYWAKSGALVLDYAVDPRPSGISVPETWWQQKYNEKPDIALILPWRLDPEKGFSITEDKRQQTKDIIFNPEKPKPGEVINIKTRIRNFSLLNTNSIVDAKFYVGDPNNGGTLIESTDGKNIFSTDDYIPARSEKIISFNWQIPNGISTFPRIYVELDPENKIDEIHESNNIGWKVLQLFDATTDIEFEENLPIEFELSQNYPNPFNPSTTIKYSLPNVASSFSSSIKLIVYDLLGREVKILVNEKQKPGNYEIEFDGSNLSSGVYFYRLQTGDYVKTMKMIIMK